MQHRAIVWALLAGLAAVAIPAAKGTALPALGDRPLRAGLLPPDTPYAAAESADWHVLSAEAPELPLSELGLTHHVIEPDPREYTVDIRIAFTYNSDLDNLDSIPEVLPVMARSPFLRQNLEENPLQTASREVGRCNLEHDRFLRRFAQAVAYALLAGGDEATADRAAELMMKREHFGLRDMGINLAARVMVRLLRRTLGQAETGGNEVALDIGVHTVTSFDSLASIEQLMLNAHRRGIGAVIVADHDTVAGALRARQVAAELKRAGRLPEEFLVIVGEEVSSREGHILALFIRDWIIPGMTATQTIREIHRQEGLAVLADPGGSNGIKLVGNLDFDGYVARPGLRRFYRTLELQDDPRANGKALLYTTQTHFSDVIEGIYTVVDTPDHTPEGLKRAIAEGNSYVAGKAYWPLLGILGFRPITKYERTLDGYYRARRALERHLEGLLGADNVRLRISWTPAVADLMDLQLVSTIRHVCQNRSALNEFPRLDGASASYGPIIIEYDRRRESVMLYGGFQF